MPTTFERFARDQMPALSAYAMVLTGDPEVAGDIVQDVMIQAFRHWGRVETLDHPSAYLKRIMTNRYLSWRRRFDVRHVVTVAADVLHDASPHQRDTAPSLVELDDQRTRLWQQMNRLSRSQRAVVVLRFYEDLTYSEIAAVMGCRESTARVTGSRAIAKLRTYLGEAGFEHLDARCEQLVSR